MKELIVDDTVVRLGQTALENWDLIKNSTPNNIWVHLESFPSGHVIIENSEPTPKVLYSALDLCLSNTKQKNMKNIYASVTNISNLKLTEKVGEVQFISNRKVKSVKIN